MGLFLVVFGAALALMAADVPANIRTAWAEKDGENGRPLYYDEPLYSNVCTLTRSTRTAHCESVATPLIS